MDKSITLLITTAISIAFIHTVLGPDHYIPFVAMAQAGRWSRAKMLTITILCGIGHVGSSVALGLAGVALGWAVGGMAFVESVRGQWAAWGLIAFGLLYFVWGIRRGVQNRPHTHHHAHADGDTHEHSHTHRDSHAHAHTQPQKANLTPWVLFTVFVLGPCEPLIPLLMVPASQHSWWGMWLVTLAFGLVTITTMTLVTLALSAGLSLLSIGRLERWSHALAGFALFTCGAVIQLLGL